jgi:hypothetical protein
LRTVEEAVMSIRQMAVPISNSFRANAFVCSGAVRAQVMPESTESRHAFSSPASQFSMALAPLRRHQKSLEIS